MSGLSRDRDVSQIPHGYKWCPHCNGYGSSLKHRNERCVRCSGTVLVAADRASEAASSPTNGKSDQLSEAIALWP